MIKEDPPVWPTEEDRYQLLRKWRQQGGSAGPYASYGLCKDCNETRYRFGKTYENMICLDCFIEKNRPKKRAKRTTVQRKNN